MNKLKTAVIGVGYLGQHHAAKYAALPTSELIAICDTNFSRAQEIADKFHVAAVEQYQQLLGQVDAVSIAVPTALHHEVAKFFLENGVHVLVEKPITTTLAQADDLIKTAEANNVLLQVGHIERFNKAIAALNSVLAEPLFIESQRLAPFKLRGTDINVVLDVMIHDIDIIQWLVKSNIKEIRASGAPVLSEYIDIANARIEFENGCVANVTASRINPKMKRKIRIFQHDCYIALDLDHKNMVIHRKGTQEMLPGVPEITREKQTYLTGDALKDQIEAFIHSILHQQPPAVSGEEGRKALATAIKITELVRKANNLSPYPVT